MVNRDIATVEDIASFVVKERTVAIKDSTIDQLDTFKLAFAGFDTARIVEVDIEAFVVYTAEFIEHTEVAGRPFKLVVSLKEEQ